jgi:hypothetical protein
MKYWEIIADHLGKSGWSASHFDSAARLLFTADA